MQNSTTRQPSLQAVVSYNVIKQKISFADKNTF